MRLKMFNQNGNILVIKHKKKYWGDPSIHLAHLSTKYTVLVDVSNIIQKDK